eukprot:m.48235 g.48235  ORF g.48235 m.48235 type:complete len:403 (+) comp6021_c0_seq2:1132-2340(+)
MNWPSSFVLQRGLQQIVQFFLWLKTQKTRTIAVVALVCLGLLVVGYIMFVKTPVSHITVFDMQQRMCIEQVHATATQFHLQHTIPREAYVTHQRISSALLDRLASEVTGVFVFYAPSGYGKSTITTHVLQDLLEQRRIEGVIPLYGDDYGSRFKPGPSSVLDWLSSSVQCPQANVVGFDGLFTTHESVIQEGKTVILIDQYELLFRMTTADKIQTMIHSVAMASVRSQRFAVLLLTQNEESCRMTLSWNGGQKIRPLFMGLGDPCRPHFWTPEELMMVAERHLNDLQSYHLSGTDRSRLETLIQNGNFTQVGEVFNFLVEHCPRTTYHCGHYRYGAVVNQREPHDYKQFHAQRVEVAEISVGHFSFVLVALLLVCGLLAYVSRYRSLSVGHRQTCENASVSA